jgi:membrane-associated protease RseP (regulator of RpoE activity)
MFFWTGDRGAYLTNVPAGNPITQILAFNGATSPAEQAGLRVGDRIEAVDGHRFGQWTQLAAYIQGHPGRRLDITVLRDGRAVELQATPVPADTVHVSGQAQLPAGKVGVLGIGVSDVIHSGFGASLSEAGGAFVHAGAGTLDALGHLVTLHGISSYVHMVTSQRAAQQSSDRLVSVVGLPSVLHQAGESGLPTVLWVLALINISIGIFNLVPLFPLDGGRVVVALYEGAAGLMRGRSYRVDMAKLLPIMYAGLAVILFFALGSMFIDLRNVAS